MADTQRTKAYLLAAYADNVTGNITPQMLRDGVVTWMDQEFVNPGDFFRLPQAQYLTADGTFRGSFQYSQIMLSACSIGAILYLTASGTWAPADAALSTKLPALAMACGSYAAAESQAVLMQKGVAWISALSGLFSGFVGRLVYLASGVAGSVVVVKPTNVTRMGVVELAGVGSAASYGKWRFDPDWAVVGA